MIAREGRESKWYQWDRNKSLWWDKWYKVGEYWLAMCNDVIPREIRITEDWATIQDGTNDHQRFYHYYQTLLEVA